MQYVSGTVPNWLAEPSLSWYSVFFPLEVGLSTYYVIRHPVRKCPSSQFGVFFFFQYPVYVKMFETIKFNVWRKRDADKGYHPLMTSVLRRSKQFYMKEIFFRNCSNFLAQSNENF